MNLIEIPIMGIKMHLSQSFPEFKDDISINVGNENNIIEFSFKKGFDYNSKLFLNICIKLKATVNSCKRAGVKKLVFID